MPVPLGLYSAGQLPTSLYRAQARTAAPHLSAHSAKAASAGCEPQAVVAANFNFGFSANFSFDLMVAKFVTANFAGRTKHKTKRD